MATESKSSFPLASVLVVIFTIAKLLGVIKWSWILVFAPLWISFAIFLTVLAVCLAVCVIGAAIS